MAVNIYADTMRMVQVFDNGGADDAFEMVLVESEEGEEDAKKISLSGFGLVKSVKRILNLPDHKQEFYEWLQANGVKKGQEGANLDKLPLDMLKRYNIADTENTLALYEFLEERFLEIDYNWRFDHELYFVSVKHITEAKIRGIKIDQTKLKKNIEAVRAEVAEITRTFKARFAKEITKVERMRLIARLRKYKGLKGRKKYLRTKPADNWQTQVVFNMGSNTQLIQLCMDVMGMQPKFFTTKEQPSFKSPVLGQWGEVGGMLAKRRKRLVVLQQMENLLELSQHDGRWHLDLRAVGTKTGRHSGGSH